MAWRRLCRRARPFFVGNKNGLCSKKARNEGNMFNRESGFKTFESKVWLSSPTMHGPEIEYVKEAYKTNWMSTVGQNINEVERIVCEKTGCHYAVALSAGTAALHMAVKLAGVQAGEKVITV